METCCGWATCSPTGHNACCCRNTALAKEYARGDITSIPAIGTTNPANPNESLFNATGGATYERLRGGEFADWRLSIEGSVARPGRYSLADLKRLPARTQITKHTCEEGWSAIAEWTGVPLRTCSRRRASGRARAS